MIDNFRRKIEYMRISITDRCNFRCRYCMPDGIEKKNMKDILTYEEIVEAAKAAGELGIKHLRITGGEPLVRKGASNLIYMLKDLPETETVSMTTNGSLLGRYADELKAAGLDSLNLSLDTLKEERFRYMTGGGELGQVLVSLDKALDLGMKVKLNCVIQKGFNEDEILLLTGFAADRNIDIRFIEMMPIGFGILSSGVSNDEIFKRISEKYGRLEECADKRGNGPAVYYSIPREEMKVGFISALSHSFCSECNGIRLDAEGNLRSCLALESGENVRPYMGDPDALREVIRRAIQSKPGSHRFAEGFSLKDEMIGIGG